MGPPLHRVDTVRLGSGVTDTVSPCDEDCLASTVVGLLLLLLHLVNRHQQHHVSLPLDRLVAAAVSRSPAARIRAPTGVTEVGGVTMPARKGLLAPQNTFLDTIATRFDGTREYQT